MKNISTRFLKICPKSGKFRGIKPLKGITRLLLPLVGIFALAWILFRVVSKPSRINYPCVQAAMPFASGFIGEVVLISLAALAFFRSKRNLLTSPLFLSAAFVVLGITGTYVVGSVNDNEVFKIPSAVVDANEPFGEAKGIFPGRVVWVYDPDATNENCISNRKNHAWFLSENNDQEVIDGMLSAGLKNITGANSDSEAWNLIFKAFNNKNGKGDVSYQSGEKIFLKLNTTSSWFGNFSTTDLSVVQNGSYGISETSPHLILSVLRQLVNVAGVAQENIYMGDPMKHIYKHIYDMLYAEFPDVHYLDYDGYANLGREKVVVSNTAKIYYSDRGKILRTGVMNPGDQGGGPVPEDALYKIFEDADYMINLPTLKGHRRAGMTAAAKNHFGSNTRSGASHLHNGLLAPTGAPYITRPGYGLYRVTVDLMGHELLGGKNLIYIMDALWPADHEVTNPKKFHMAPFNNDWMSSVFVSMDPVAIESVGYDFLRSEFTDSRPSSDGAGTYVQMEGTDDYLHQCASSANWPDSIQYDPENDGTVIGSLGVHEHWNDEVNMQYSRNLGTGSGIELVKVLNVTSVDNNAPGVPSQFILQQNYPNPFNPSTTIKFSIAEGSNVRLSVYDVKGKIVETLINNEYKQAGNYSVSFKAVNLSSGVYFIKLNAGTFSQSIKMILMK